MAEVEKEEYKFPDEVQIESLKDDKKEPEKVEFTVEGESDVEVEIVDDTPEKDRGRKPLEKPVADPTEDELQDYSDKVQSRIKELTHARHDERRAREAAQREKEEAIRFAQAAIEENKKLKERLTHGETNYISQAQRLAEVEVEKAKAALKTAHEAGDTEAFVEAQAALNRAQLIQERVKAFKPTPLQKAPQPVNVAPQPTRPPVPQVDEKALAWKRKNSWFGQDDAMTGYAIGVHNELVKAGYNTQSDEYYEAIDSRLKRSFPDRFKSDDVSDKAEKGKKPATVVAPSSRATSAKKIVLTPTQVSLAKKLGVPLQEYARQVAAEMRKQNA
jgi:hypothetical protein